MREVAPETFKETLRRFASGVTVVTVRSGSETHGMTASSFASASLEPPLIVVCLDKASNTLRLLRESGKFAVNILSEGQESLARLFAGTGPKSFDGSSSSSAASGAPLLDDALAWLDCRTHEIVDAGDHEIVLGLVTSCGMATGAPLLYFDGAYRSPAFR